MAWMPWSSQRGVLALAFNPGLLSSSPAPNSRPPLVTSPASHAFIRSPGGRGCLVGAAPRPRQPLPKQAMNCRLRSLGPASCEALCMPCKALSGSIRPARCARLYTLRKMCAVHAGSSLEAACALRLVDGCMQFVMRGCPLPGKS